MTSERSWGGAGRGLVIFVMMFVVQAACSGAREPARAEPTSQPTAASRPSFERILVRIGDRAEVTQAEVERLLASRPPANRRAAASAALATVASNKLFLLYLGDHPEFVTPEDIEKEIETDMKKARMKTREDWQRRIEQSGISWKEYIDLARIRAGRNKLARRGAEKSKDQAYLRKVFDEHPDYYNGATVKIRQILFAVPMTATPEQKKKRLKDITRLREELLSGKKTWEEAVKLSNDNTRNKGGLLGALPRYMSASEPFMKAAWAMQPGQTSEIVESPMGYHIIQVLQRLPGYRDFDDPHTQFELRAAIEREPLVKVVKEIQENYPLIGVQPIDMEAVLALPAPPTRPARTPMTRPGRTATRPGTRSIMRPATRPSGIVRPVVRPATRPARMTVPARPARPAVPTSGLPSASTPVSQPAPGR